MLDFMPVDTENSSVIRIVEGIRGTVSMHCSIVLRFDYGLDSPSGRDICHRNDHISRIIGSASSRARGPCSDGNGLGIGAAARSVG